LCSGRGVVWTTDERVLITAAAGTNISSRRQGQGRRPSDFKGAAPNLPRARSLARPKKQSDLQMCVCVGRVFGVNVFYCASMCVCAEHQKQHCEQPIHEGIALFRQEIPALSRCGCCAHAQDIKSRRRLMKQFIGACHGYGGMC